MPPDANLPARRSKGALDVALDSIERDRREPDKVLCHLLTARRALFDLRERAVDLGACSCTWGIRDADDEYEIVDPDSECAIHA